MEKSDVLKLSGLFLLAFLLCLPMILFDNYPKKDASMYYLPMIRQFAAGNWDHAYYPMVPPLLPTIGGIVAKWTSVPVYAAGKFTSALFFALATLPLFFLHKTVFNKRIAYTATFLFLLCSPIMQYSGSGLVDGGKIFFMITGMLSLVALVKGKHRMAVTGFVLSGSGMALIRGEGIVFTCLLWVIFAVLEVMTSVRHRISFFPKRTLIATFGIILFVGPWVYYEFKTTGYPVTDSRQIPLVKRLFASIGKSDPFRYGSFPNEPETLQEMLQIKITSENGETINIQREPWDALVVAQTVKKAHEPGLPAYDFFRNIMNGLYPPYLVFALIAGFIRIRRKEWGNWESSFLAVIILHTAFFSFIQSGIAPQQRYIIQIVPFMLGWAAVGLTDAFNLLKSRCGNRFGFVPYFMILMGASISIWEGTDNARLPGKETKREEISASHECASWIKNKGMAWVPEPYPVLNSTTTVYQNGGKPIIMDSDSRISFFAEADVVIPRHFKQRFSLKELIRLCQIKSVHFVVVEETLLEFCPELRGHEKYPEIFTKLFRVKNRFRDDLWVLGFRSNLLQVKKEI